MSQTFSEMLKKNTGYETITEAVQNMQNNIDDEELINDTPSNIPSVLLRFFQIFGFRSDNIIPFFNDNFEGYEKNVLCGYLNDNIETLRILDNGNSHLEEYEQIKDDEDKILIFCMIFCYMWQLQTGIDLAEAVRKQKIDDYPGYIEKMNHWKSIFKKKFNCEVIFGIYAYLEFFTTFSYNYLPSGNIILIDDNGESIRIANTDIDDFGNKIAILSINHSNTSYNYYENGKLHRLYDETTGVISDFEYNYGEAANCALICFIRFIGLLNKTYGELINIVNELDPRFNGMMLRLQPNLEPLVNEIISGDLTLQNVRTKLGNLCIENGDLYEMISNFATLFEYIFTKVYTISYFKEMKLNGEQKMKYVPKTDLKNALKFIEIIAGDNKKDVQVPLYIPVYDMEDDLSMGDIAHVCLEIWDSKTNKIILFDPNFSNLLVHNKLHPFYFNYTASYGGLFYNLDSSSFSDIPKFVQEEIVIPEQEQKLDIYKPSRKIELKELTEEETNLRNKLLQDGYFKIAPKELYEIYAQQHPDKLQEILDHPAVKDGEYLLYLSEPELIETLVNNDRYLDYKPKNDGGRKLTSDEILEQNRLLTTHPLFAQLSDSELTLRDLLEKTHPDKLKEYIAKNMDLSNEAGINANYQEIKKNAIYDK